MKKRFLSLLFISFSAIYGFAQQTTIIGVVKDELSSQPMSGVLVQIEGTSLSLLTDSSGSFTFSTDIPLGDQILYLSKIDYLDLRFPVAVVDGEILELSDLLMQIDNSSEDLFTITLSDDELNDDMSGADNISGLLSASQDIFQRAAAFEFSQSFFRVRGLNTDNGTVLMNGIEMNKTFILCRNSLSSCSQF